MEAANYWETAVHLLYLLLGWADPGKGLQAWYRAGRPTTDARLRFLRDVYDSQGQLGLLARHLWERGGPHHEQVLSECSQREWLATSRHSEEFLGSEWLRELETTFPVGRLRRDPYHGGTNPLHLWHSVDPHDGLARPESAMHLMPSDRRAVLTLDRATGWYRALCERGADLPFLGDRSWHVDVVVKPLGWMGTFRQSRTTRLWFQGRHMVHMMGN